MARIVTNNKSDFVFNLFAFSLPFTAFGIINTADFGIDLSLLLVVLLAGKYIADILLLRRKVTTDHIDRLILFFLYIASFSIVIAALSGPADVYRMFKQIVLLAIYCILFLHLKRHFSSNPGSLLSCIKYYIFSAYFVILFGVYQFLSGMFGLPYPHSLLKAAYNASMGEGKRLLIYDVSAGGFDRVESVFIEPGVFALFLLGCIPLFCCLASSNARFPFRNPLLNKIWFPLSIFIMLLTFSLAGYAGLCVTVVVFFLSQAKDRKVFKRLNIKTGKIIFPIFSILVIVSVFLSNNEFVARIYKTPLRKAENFIKSANINERDKQGLSTIAVLQTWATTGRIVRQRPFLGVGYGNYQSYFEIYAPNWAIMRANYVAGTSVFCRILVETGIIGAVVFSWFFIALLRKSYFAIKNTNDAALYLILKGVWLSLVCYSINFLFIKCCNITWPQFWFLLALVGAVSSLRLKKREENEIRYQKR